MIELETNHDSAFALRVTGGSLKSLIIVFIISLGAGLVGYIANPFLIPALVICATIAISFFVQPFIPLCVFFVLLYTRPADYVSALEPLKLPKLAMLSCIISTFMQYWIIRGEKLLKSPIDKYLHGFVFIMFLSFIGSIDARYSLNVFTEGFLKVLIMVFIIKNILDTKKKLLIFAWLLIGLVLFLSIMSIRNLIIGENLVGELGRVKLTGILGDPNDLALAIVIMLPYIYGFISAYRNPYIRFLLLVILGMSLFTIKATISRGGFLGLATVTFLFAFIGRPRKTQRIVLIVMIFLILLVIVGGVGMRHDEGATASAMSRFKLWEAGIRMAIASPIWGQGLANYKFKSSDYSPGYDVNKTAHSIIFLVLGELGVVGLYFFMMILFTELKMGWKLQKVAGEYPRYSPYRAIARACFPAFCGFIVCGLTLSQSYTWFPYIIISLTIAAIRVLKR